MEKFPYSKSSPPNFSPSYPKLIIRSGQKLTAKLKTRYEKKKDTRSRGIYAYYLSRDTLSDRREEIKEENALTITLGWNAKVAG